MPKERSHTCVNLTFNVYVVYFCLVFRLIGHFRQKHGKWLLHIQPNVHMCLAKKNFGCVFAGPSVPGHVAPPRDRDDIIIIIIIIIDRPGVPIREKAGIEFESTNNNKNMAAPEAPPVAGTVIGTEYKIRMSELVVAILSCLYMYVYEFDKGV